VKDFSHLSYIDLIHILHSQYALSNGILSNKRDHLSFDRIIKRLESRCHDIKKHIVDIGNQRKLYLGFSLADWGQGIGLRKE
jgi:hypothetical protein